MSILGWYWTEVKGNVLAVFPAALLAGFWIRAKHQALVDAHRAHAAKLEAILKHLDPDAETDGMLDIIADRVNDSTPGGVGAVLEEIRKRDADERLPPNS